MTESPDGRAKAPGTPSAGAKPPARPAPEVRADIERERAGLERSFEELRGGLDEAVDAGRRRAADAGRKARIVGPAVAGAVALLIVVPRVLRRRSRRT